MIFSVLVHNKINRSDMLMRFGAYEHRFSSNTTRMFLISRREARRFHSGVHSRSLLGPESIEPHESPKRNAATKRWGCIGFMLIRGCRTGRWMYTSLYCDNISTIQRLSFDFDSGAVCSSKCHQGCRLTPRQAWAIDQALHGSRLSGTD